MMGEGGGSKNHNIKFVEKEQNLDILSGQSKKSLLKRKWVLQ